MSQYKDTLNLPQTAFPMKANLPQREPHILKKWAEMNLYQTVQQKNKGKKKFILHSGPPYANGHIHLGTATNNILKDMIVKSKILLGFDAPFVPGWDCHGLPIELNVEKKIGKPNQKVSAADFRKACRAYAEEFIHIQREEFIRLGVLADFEHPYLTMDYHYEANIIRSLSKIIQNKDLQKGYKPVHWCLDCGSALAEAEVEYAEKKSPSVDVRFFVNDTKDFLSRFNQPKEGIGLISVPIWTTTPWTLPANQAVALNALLQYVLVECDEKEQFLIAEDLLEAVMARNKINDYRILGKLAGEKLEGITLKHPFYDKSVPIVMGEHVTIESGTGNVHIAPAHGQDDYLVGKKYDLALDNPVGDNGCYKESTLLFAGVHVSKANEKIIETLQSKGTLAHLESLTHSYPHCWRHKTPLIFRATPQWFISMDKNHLRKRSLSALENVSFIPDWGKNRIEGMILNRPDWCISRQRTWGVPLTLYTHKETGELHPDTISLIETIAQKVEQEGIEAWFDEANTLLGADAKHYQACQDVLDVWFDSGVSHECVLKARKELAFPADIVLEGSDQHRGWFQSSLLSSSAMNDAAPYRAVLTHGFVVDGQGRKMSKSLGNVIAPDEVIRSLGADILRLWVASVDYRYEINASKEILNRMSESYRRIRNTARFLLANLHGFDPGTQLVPFEEMLKLDQWAVDRTNEIQKEIKNAFDTYQFHLIIQKLHYFCVTDMGGFYLDIIKDRQYTMQEKSLGRLSAQTALFHIVHALSRWMMPILSFTAEEIWEHIPGKHEASILLTEWYDGLQSLKEDESMNRSFWVKIQAVRDAVNKEMERLRALQKLGSALEAHVALYCAPHLRKELAQLEDELKFILITSSATVKAEHEGPLDMICTDVPGLSLVITPSTDPKCERCWHRPEDIGKDHTHPTLCGRCILNISGEGETRRYA